MRKFIQYSALACLLISLTGFAALAILPVKFEVPNTRLLNDDKLRHFLVFFTLTLLAAIGLARIKLLALISALVLFGFAVEYIQPLFGRQGDLKDALANLGGIAAAWSALGAASLRSALRQTPPGN